MIRKIENRIFVSFLLSCLINLSCNSSIDNNQEDLEKITHDNNALVEKYSLEGNAAKLSGMYDANARLCPNGDDFYIGREAIFSFWSNALAEEKITRMETITMSVSGNADVIYETGITYSESVAEDSVHKSTVKFINVWRRQKDNSYKLAVDFWNNPQKILPKN